MIKHKSFALIAVIIIVVLMAIVALGIVVYISQALEYNIASIDQQKAFYAAQAGVMAAVADYEADGLVSAQADIAIDPNTYYSFGGSGMFFIADSSTTNIIANRKLKNVSMTNVSGGDLTITHVQVSWTPDAGENLISIDLGRATAEWTGTAQSGTNIDMADFTIPAGTTENDVWLDWEIGSDITPMTITAVITFSDGSTVEVMLLNSGLTSDNVMNITSTGKIVTNYTWRRTLKAAYDIGTSKIVSWEESQDHILP
ncbi:MAG: hypothetical protein K9L86_05165 [Candidatus Omnitrophica bacterium]|nr:hypothetical protein [Candidatus Omnitrophota bacterium]